MNGRMKQWLEAAKILAVDPTAQIVCPKCGEANLLVTDIPYRGDASRWERHIQCPACHTTGSVLMRKETDHKELAGDVSYWDR
jgi:transposase-like protein